ncbi:hypothetical protein SFUMM280S_07962 [Streptomyces fumanus]
MRSATRRPVPHGRHPMVVATAALALTGAGTASAAPQQTSSVATCTASNVKLTVTKVSRPVNHLLLKATNTGSKSCYAYKAPFLRAGADAQAPLQWVKASKPKSVVKLKPGKSAYAGIITSSPDGEGGHKEKKLGVTLTNKKGNATGKEKTVKLPGSVFFNSAAAVTYWQKSASDALTW